MSITVLVACFNHGKFLKQTLDSIINQTYTGNIDIILSDDASEDNTKEVIIDYHKKKLPDNRHLTTIRHLKNLGGYGRGNWSFLFKQLTDNNEYTAMLDGDDYLAEDRFAKQISYMEENSLNGCHSDITALYEDGSIKADKWWEQNSQFIANPMTIESQIKNNRVFICTLIAKTDLFKASARFDRFTELNIFLGDYALTNLMILLGGRIGFIDEALSFYRFREHSESHRDPGLTVADTGHVSWLTATGELLK